MASIKDVAMRAGVSIATVSNVYNDSARVKDATKAKVLLAADELNYNCVGNLDVKKRNMNRQIGVITEDITEFNTPKIVDAITEFSEKLGWDMLLINLGIHSETETDEFEYMRIAKNALNVLLAKNVDGIIYVANQCREVKNLVDGYATPVVYAYCSGNNENSVSVIYKNGKIAYNMTKHLIEKGHKNIGIIAGLENNIHVQDRIVGIQKAHFDAGILYNPRNIERGDWNCTASGYNCIQRLLNNDVTAVFCLNDILAVGVYEYAADNRIKIPKDLSVVGFDDRDCARFLYPKLTTVALPLKKIGESCVQNMSILLQDKDLLNDNTNIKLDCEIVFRDSVARLK